MTARGSGDHHAIGSSSHIGQGKIGRKAFRHIVNDPRLRNLPGCLETPKSDDLGDDIKNLAVLRSLSVDSTWLVTQLLASLASPVSRANSSK